MNPLQTIRIVCLLALIFAAGVLTGRFTAPTETRYLPAGRNPPHEIVLAGLRTELKLTPAQEQQLRELFTEMEPQMQRFPPGSQERLEILRKNFPRMKTILNETQYEGFEGYVRDVERRFEIMRRRRGF